MRKPWERAPATPIGDADVGKIYHAVGLALSRWQILEVALSYLHGTILQAKVGAEVAAYRRAAGVGSRLRLIKGALEAQRAVMPGPLHAEIVAFLDSEIAPLADRRNEIAQGTAVLARRGHYLVAPGYIPRKLQWRRVPVATDAFPFRRLAYTYTAAQVADFGEHFWECSRRTFQLGNRLVEAREAVSRAPTAPRPRTLTFLTPPMPRRLRPGA
jgi:hypothetical protein